MESTTGRTIRLARRCLRVRSHAGRRKGHRPNASQDWPFVCSHPLAHLAASRTLPRTGECDPRGQASRCQERRPTHAGWGMSGGLTAVDTSTPAAHHARVAAGAKHKNISADCPAQSWSIPLAS
eukprot:scaffold204670_cov31-Tisochrysis_lutea.AAC.2